MSRSDLITVSITEPTPAITPVPPQTPYHSYPWNMSHRVLALLVEDGGRVLSLGPVDVDTQNWLIDNQDAIAPIIQSLDKHINQKFDNHLVAGVVQDIYFQLRRAFPNDTFQIKTGEYKTVIDASHQEFVEYR
jgi:hypothetical protein